jgi:hypothetical protein
MKQLYVLTLLFLLCVNTLSDNKFKIITTENLAPYEININGRMISFIPDPMHKALIPEYVQLSDIKEIDMRAPGDSLVNFPGFPQYHFISGQNWMTDGAIFCNMDSDPEMEIVSYFNNYAIAINYDGSDVPGWPVFINNRNWSAPAYGDIDGDLQGEIIVVELPPQGTFTGGKLHAFEQNGTPVTGFPVDAGYFLKTPVLADLDGDNVMEIFVANRIPGEILVYKGDGTMYPGWPRPLDYQVCGAAVGDVTGDGIPEVFMEGYNYLGGWDKNGNTLPGFPYILTEDKCSYSPPVLADLDKDGKREIIFGTHVPYNPYGYVHVITSNGTKFPGAWPVRTGGWVMAPVSVGYINGDNSPDIAVGDVIVSDIPLSHMYAWHTDGTPLAGFPAGPFNAINSQAMIGNVDNDNEFELIFDDNIGTATAGRLMGVNHDGTFPPGWPKITLGSTFAKSICFADVNRDGMLDIIGGAGNQQLKFNLWNGGVTYNPALIKIPIYQYNERHNGVWVDDSILIGITPVNTEIPKEFELFQNYPNPFNPATNIKFSLPSREFIKLAVYDVTGREIETIVNQKMNAGNYTVNFNADKLSSGVYFYKLITSRFVQTKKMILIK